ncbi:MAG: hypothetical protein IJZ87_06155 [Bacteroidales bacterium]|nr:hypothetical protein [Bacteroidales bacterium]
MKNKLLLTLTFCVIIFSSFAQNDEYKRYIEKQNQNYTDFKNKSKSDYISFQDSINKSFASYLEKSWKEYSVFLGEEPESEPKPKSVPVAKPDDSQQGEMEVVVEKVIERAASSPQDETNVVADGSEVNVDVSSINNNSSFSVDFFNSKITLDVIDNFSEIRLSGTSEKDVAALWNKFSSDAYSNMAYQMKKIAISQNINDYGLYLFISQTAQTMFPYKPNEQLVYMVFMLNQLGYKAKIARSDDDLIALIAVKQIVYKRSYLTSENDRYYVFTAKPNEIMSCSSIFTYDNLMQNCMSNIDLSFNKPLRLRNNIKTITLSTEDFGEINVKVNLEDIDFYDNYPHTEMQVYANAEMSDEINNSLLGPLKSQINEMSYVDATNYLLDFIYATCNYKTDGEQFGYEKPMFCEETLYYPYSDCEDNSILFSYLVRKLLGLDVVLLDYPGHIATAVKLPEEVSGSYLHLEDGKYMVCDPTYYGASVGMSMPKYQDVKLSVIQLNKLKRY